MKTHQLIKELMKQPPNAEVVFCQDEHTHYEVIEVTYNDLGHLTVITVD